MFFIVVVRLVADHHVLLYTRFLIVGLLWSELGVQTFFAKINHDSCVSPLTEAIEAEILPLTGTSSIGQLIVGLSLNSIDRVPLITN